MAKTVPAIFTVAVVTAITKHALVRNSNLSRAETQVGFYQASLQGQVPMAYT